jgi:rubredoxin
MTARIAWWRCHYCGAEFTAWEAAQRHSHQPGHRRIELIL